jgi:hypothetical protein
MQQAQENGGTRDDSEQRKASCLRNKSSGEPTDCGKARKKHIRIEKK